MRRPSTPSVAAGSRRSVRISTLLASALLLVGLGGWYAGSELYGARTEQGVRFARAVTDSHEAMLDQETGLRGYQITGDPEFLEPYRDGQSRYLSATARAWSTGSTPVLEARLLETERLAARWVTEHAVPGLALTTPGSPAPGAALGLADGKVLFDAYREAHDALITRVRAGNNATLATRERLDLLVHGAQVLLAVLAVGHAALRRKRLQDELVRPVAEVTAVLHLLAEGDASARPVPYPAAELDALSSGVRALAQAAQQRGADADAERQAAAGRAAVYQQVLSVAHELSGYLDRAELVPALLRTVVQTARLEEAAVLGVEAGHLGAPLGSRTASGATGLLEDGSLLLEPARECVRFLRLTVTDDGLCAALPLVHGGTVHGVLLVRSAEALDDDRLITLRSLSLAAGGALTAAQLHEQVRAESRSDALTGLYNRRRFEEDLAHELGLVERVGVPVSLLLLDVDRFKDFNDTRGHREGDRLLHDLGRLLVLSLRSTDRAYRYGGEELAVLLVGAGAADAAQVAEQLRQLVAARTDVTVSIGTVTAHHDAGSDAVVEAADRALYVAKQGGRDRVESGSLDRPPSSSRRVAR